MNNLFSQESANKDKEITEILSQTKTNRIERIISFGAQSPANFYYDQDEDEWVCLLEGSAKIQFEDKEIELKKGEQLFIKAHQKHRVSYTSKDCIWLAVFSKI